MRSRAEQLEAGGPELWASYMNQLRAIHLSEAAPERHHHPEKEATSAATATAAKTLHDA